MDARIRRDRIPNNFNVADVLYQAVLGLYKKNIRPVVKTKIIQRTKREITVQVPENPAAAYELGWRRDA